MLRVDSLAEVLVRHALRPHTTIIIALARTTSSTPG
jgi:hypothetical protein